MRLVLLTVFLGLLLYGGQRLWRWLAPRLTGHWPRIALIGGFIILLGMAMTGRLGLLLTALGIIGAFMLRNLPQALRIEPLLQRLWRQTSTLRRFWFGAKAVETAWLRLRLDLTSGTVVGSVLSGRFTGRQLRDLNLDQLLSLYRELQPADTPSASLLESYLDLLYGNEWRRVAASGQNHSQKQGNGKAAPAASKLRREEACKVLGVSANATQKEIIAAHRRLMQKYHPDRGGSDYLATKINLAKDVLLKKK